jgi:hypothetical protein
LFRRDQTHIVSPLFLLCISRFLLFLPPFPFLLFYLPFLLFLVFHSSPLHPDRKFGKKKTFAD